VFSCFLSRENGRSNVGRRGSYCVRGTRDGFLSSRAVRRAQLIQRQIYRCRSEVVGLVLDFELVGLLHLALSCGGCEFDPEVAFGGKFLPELVDLAQAAIDDSFRRQLVG